MLKAFARAMQVQPSSRRRAMMRPARALLPTPPMPCRTTRPACRSVRDGGGMVTQDGEVWRSSGRRPIRSPMLRWGGRLVGLRDRGARGLLILAAVEQGLSGPALNKGCGGAFPARRGFLLPGRARGCDGVGKWARPAGAVGCSAPIERGREFAGVADRLPGSAWRAPGVCRHGQGCLGKAGSSHLRASPCGQVARKDPGASALRRVRQGGRRRWRDCRLCPPV